MIYKLLISTVPT